MNIFKKFSAPKETGQTDHLSQFHAEAAATSVHNAGAAYDNASLIASGATPQNVAMLGFFSNLVLSFLCIKAPGFICRLGTLKRSVLTVSIMGALSWLPLVWLFFNGAATPDVLIPLFIINALPIAILVPMRDSWLAGLVPGKSVGKYFSLRSCITSVAYLVTFYLMGYMLDMFGANSFQGFAVIFIAAAFAMFFNAIMYRGVKYTPTNEKKDDDGFDFHDFLREAGKGNLGAYIIFLACFTFAVNLASPFFSVYVLRDLKLSYLTYTIIVSSEYIARIIAAILWGRYADNAGHLKVLKICCHLIPIVTLTWIFVRSPVELVFLHLFSGIVWAGFDLCSRTFIYKSAPDGRRLKYIMYEKSLSTMAVAMGNMGGTYLLSIAIPIFGNPILSVFLISAIMRILVVRNMFNRLVDLTLPEKPVRKVLKPVMTRTAIPAGMYYRPGEWVKAKERPEIYAVPRENVLTATSPQRPALYEEPKKWTQYRQNLKACRMTSRFKLDKVGIAMETGGAD